MSSTFFIPAVNIMGNDCLDEAMVAIGKYGFRKALIVTDQNIAKLGFADLVRDKLAEAGGDAFDHAIHRASRPCDEGSRGHRGSSDNGPATGGKGCPAAACGPVNTRRTSSGSRPGPSSS